MKFHLQAQTANVVTGSGPGWVRVGTTDYRGNVLLLPDRVVEGWTTADIEALTESEVSSFLGYAPEIVLLGTGVRQRFPSPRLLAPLTSQRIGVEIMDTPAACRTFNILVAEGRRVLAALIV